MVRRTSPVPLLLLFNWDALEQGIPSGRTGHTGRSFLMECKSY